MSVPAGQVRGEAVDAVAALGVRCSGALHRKKIQDSTTLLVTYKMYRTTTATMLTGLCININSINDTKRGSTFHNRR